ncbi:MAG: hypothetical protein IKI76_11605 [Selenomonadaceae bacterium]|nr:hypothetical protein [Selenomonadaceae bacterium]
MRASRSAALFVVASLTFGQMQDLFDAVKQVSVDDDFDISDTLDGEIAAIGHAEDEIIIGHIHIA